MQAKKVLIVKHPKCVLLLIFTRHFCCHSIFISLTPSLTSLNYCFLCGFLASTTSHTRRLFIQHSFDGSSCLSGANVLNRDELFAWLEDIHMYLQHNMYGRTNKQTNDMMYWNRFLSSDHLKKRDQSERNLMKRRSFLKWRRCGRTATAAAERSKEQVKKLIF